MMDNDQVTTVCKARIFQVDQITDVQVQNDKTIQRDPSDERLRDKES